MNTDDTIVAISTPPGRGGIGVVRLSGGHAVAIVSQLIRTKVTIQPWAARTGELLDRDGAVVDQVVVTFFRKPHSYTAEDVVEVSCHGAPVVLRFLLERAMEAGARLAEPGEFTMRAFLNGRIDLAQAEAVRDLIESQTLYQAKVAAQQVEGAVSRRLAPIKKQLIDLIALLEAGIDFAEDDVSVLPAEQIDARIEAVRSALDEYAGTYKFGRVVHEGLTLAIVGRPNVGKSSLFNRLIQRDRAIVTAAPGTTRDLVTETISFEGIPIQLVDTAGIRHARDEAESIGIRKSWEALADADLTLIVLDACAGLLREDRELIARTTERANALLVWNKIDLVNGVAGASPPAQTPSFEVSAQTGAGIAELRAAIVAAALPGLDSSREAGFLTNVRQERLVRDAIAALETARAALGEHIPHEMLLLDLYSALRPLDAITGQTTIDDILNQIFSTFCIGK